MDQGKKAALNLIDLEALTVQPPETVYDLPANGRRLIQQIGGDGATVQSGQITYEDGVPTGALPGKLLRGPQPAL